MSSFEDGEITVGYWSIRGLAAPLRMMVMFAGRPLNAVLYQCVENAAGDEFDRSAWFSQKETLKEENPLINLPYIRIGTKGKLITQSTACFMALGRVLNLVGDTDSDLSDVEQLVGEAMDLRNSIVRFAYSCDPPLPQWLHSTTKATGNTTFSKLELWLRHKYSANEWSNPAQPVFFVGERASTPDFHIWELLDQLVGMYAYNARQQSGSVPEPTAMVEELFQEAPALKAFYLSFKNLPQNERYFQSPLHRLLPANNVSAKGYGATLSGEPWCFQTSKHNMPYSGLSGKY
jgi:glutathione S-transferase